MSRAWRVRAVAFAAACGFLVVGLGIRLLSGRGGAVDGSGVVAQHSGTALYAAMLYAGVLVLVPSARPWVAGTAAVTFCWVVELAQLTGVPAALSERSVIARLVLGAQFDAADLGWYVVGVLAPALLHALVTRRVVPDSPGLS